LGNQTVENGKPRRQVRGGRPEYRTEVWPITLGLSKCGKLPKNWLDREGVRMKRCRRNKTGEQFRKGINGLKPATINLQEWCHRGSPTEQLGAHQQQDLWPRRHRTKKERLLLHFEPKLETKKLRKIHGPQKKQLLGKTKQAGKKGSLWKNQKRTDLLGVVSTGSEQAA